MPAKPKIQTSEAKGEATLNPQPANIALRSGSSPGTIRLVPAPRMVKRRYQVVPTISGLGQSEGSYEVTSPLGTTLCRGKKAACDFIMAALLAFDPEGECSL